MLRGRMVCTSCRPSCVESHSASLTKSIFLSVSESVESDMSVGRCRLDLVPFDSAVVGGDCASTVGEGVARIDESLAPEDIDDDVDDFFDFFAFFSFNFPEEDDDAFASGSSETLSADNFVSYGSM